MKFQFTEKKEACGDRWRNFFQKAMGPSCGGHTTFPTFKTNLDIHYLSVNLHMII